MKIFDLQEQEINDLLEAIGGYTSHIFREAKKGSKLKAPDSGVVAEPAPQKKTQSAGKRGAKAAVAPDAPMSRDEFVAKAMASAKDKYLAAGSTEDQANAGLSLQRNYFGKQYDASVASGTTPTDADVESASIDVLPQEYRKALGIPPTPVPSRPAPPEYLIPPQLDAEKELAAKAKLAAAEREYRAMFKKAGMSGDELEANVAQELDRVRKMDADVDAYISGLSNPSAPEAPTEPVQEPTTEPEAPVAGEPAAVSEPEVGPETRNRLQALAGIEPTEPTVSEPVSEPEQPKTEPTIPEPVAKTAAEVPAEVPVAVVPPKEAPSAAQTAGSGGKPKPSRGPLDLFGKRRRMEPVRGDTDVAQDDRTYDSDDDAQLGMDFDAPASSPAKVAAPSPTSKTSTTFPADTSTYGHAQKASITWNKPATQTVPTAPKEPTPAPQTDSPEEPAQDSPSTDASGGQQPWQNPKPHTAKKSYGLRDKIKAAASAFKDPGSVGNNPQSDSDRKFAKRWKELWERLQNEGVLDENLTADELTYIFTETQVGQTLTEQYMAEENINEERYTLEEWMGMMEEGNIVEGGNAETKAKKNAHADSLSTLQFPKDDAPDAHRESGRTQTRKSGKSPEDAIKDKVGSKASDSAKFKRFVTRGGMGKQSDAETKIINKAKLNESVEIDTDRLQRLAGIKPLHD